MLASPVLTAMGTALALWLGGLMGSSYGVTTVDDFWVEVRRAIFPSLRLRFWESATIDLRSSFSDSYTDGLIEFVTYPPLYHLIKAVTFIVVIIAVAEAAGRVREGLTPRHVPGVITSAVVISGLLVIISDWGFSQLLLLRH